MDKGEYPDTPYYNTLREYDRVREAWHGRYSRDLCLSERRAMLREIRKVARDLEFWHRYRENGTVWAPVINFHIPTDDPADYCTMPSLDEIREGTGTWGRRRIGTA